MAQTINGGRVNIVVSGSHADALASYANRLVATDAWKDRQNFIADQKFTNIVVTDNPNDIPASMRSSMWNSVYNNQRSDDKEIAGVTNDPRGSSTAYVLLNTSVGTQDGYTRQPDAAFTHEIWHVGETNSASHPDWWVQSLTPALQQMGISPDQALARPGSVYDHSADSIPPLDRSAPQNSNLNIKRDDPYNDGGTNIYDDNGSDYFVNINSNGDETGSVKDRSGNQIDLSGYDISANANSATVNFQNNTSANVFGSNDRINLQYNGGDYVGAFGSNVVITGDAGSSSVNLGGVGTSATVYGGGYVGLCDQYQSLTLGDWGSTVATVPNAIGEYINGTNSTVYFGAGATANVYGSGDGINFQGNTGSYVGVHGQNMTVTGDSGSNVASLCDTGSSATVWGGGTAVLTGNNESLTAGDWGSYIAAVGGVQNESISANHSTVRMDGNTSANVFGGSDGIVLTANGNDHLGVFGQSQTVYNDNGSDGVNLGGNGTSATIYGGGYVGMCDSNQTLTLGDWGSTVNTVSNITGDTVIGNHSTINFDHDVTATVDGSNDAVTGVFGHDRVEVSGNDDSFRFNSSDIDFQGQTYGDSFAGGGDSYFENGSYLGGDDPNGGYEGSGWDTNWDDGWYDDPIVLNLKGEAVQTVSADQSNARFNARNDGNLVGVGWGTPGEGYLVDLPDGKTGVTQDADLVQSYAALRSLDTNHDGQLDASDAAWSNLKVWVDPVGHADPSQGTLVSLGDLGIVSIDVNATPDRHGDNGNTILDDGSFTRNDGTKGNIAGVAFRIAGNSAQPTTTASASPVSDLSSASATQASQLVNAMATFGVNSAADTTLSTSAQASPAVLSVDPSVYQPNRVAA